MPQYKGDNSTVGYKIETAFAETPVAQAQTTWLGIMPTSEFNEEIDWKDFHTVGYTRDLFLEAQGTIKISGNMPIVFQNGRLLYLAMGGISETGSGTITHAISGAQSLPSICIETVYKGDNNFLRYYIGTKIDSLEIEVTEAGEVKANVSFLSSKGYKSANAISTITPVTTTPYMYYNGCMTIDGYADFDITTWKWKISNNGVPKPTVRCTDGQYAKMIVEGKREYELTFDVIIPDAATYNTKIYDLLKAGTPITITLPLVRTALSDQATLTCTNVTIRSAPHNIPEAGEEVKISVTAKPRTCTWSVIDDIETYE